MSCRPTFAEPALATDVAEIEKAPAVEPVIHADEHGVAAPAEHLGPRRRRHGRLESALRRVAAKRHALEDVDSVERAAAHRAARRGGDRAIVRATGNATID